MHDVVALACMTVVVRDFPVGDVVMAGTNGLTDFPQRLDGFLGIGVIPDDEPGGGVESDVKTYSTRGSGQGNGDGWEGEW